MAVQSDGYVGRVIAPSDAIWGDPATSDDVVISLDRQTSVECRVVDVAGRPIEAALVEAMARGGFDAGRHCLNRMHPFRRVLASESTSDASGTVRIRLPGGGPLRFRASAAGHAPCTVTIESVEELAPPVTLVLTRMMVGAVRPPRFFAHDQPIASPASFLETRAWLWDEAEMGIAAPDSTTLPARESERLQALLEERIGERGLLWFFGLEVNATLDHVGRFEARVAHEKSFESIAVRMKPISDFTASDVGGSSRVVQVARPGTLRVSVADQEGRPRDLTASMRLVNREDRRCWDTRFHRTEEGSYSIDAPAGEYRLVSCQAGFVADEFEEQPVTIAADALVDIKITLLARPSARLTVAVRSPDGAPVLDAKTSVVCLDQLAAFELDGAAFDVQEGAASSLIVPPGRYKARSIAFGYPSQPWLEFELRAGEARQVVVALQPVATPITSALAPERWD